MLLVLDNCEHLLGACAAITAALLQPCAKVHVLATSREPLRVPGESTVSIPPLLLGDAVELFSWRAAGRGRQITAENRCLSDERPRPALPCSPNGRSCSRTPGPTAGSVSCWRPAPGPTRPRTTTPRTTRPRTTRCRTARHREPRDHVRYPWRAGPAAAARHPGAGLLAQLARPADSYRPRPL